MSGDSDMTLTTQQTISTISPPQTPPTLQQRCSQLHTSLMNCTIIELQTLSSQLSLDTTNCNDELDYINLIENFSRSKKEAASVDDGINCNDDNDNNTIQSTPINLDNQQQQDVEHMNDHNTPDDILPQDNDYRSHLQTQLHTTLQSLSLIELQSLATRLSIDYSNCLHDKIDENFIQSGDIQEQAYNSSTGEDMMAERRYENEIIEKLARQHVIQLIEEKALNLPIVLECGNSTDTTTDDDMNDDDDTSVISAITTYTSLVNSAQKQNSNHTSKVDNTGSTGVEENIKSNHNALSNNYREYLQSIRNGGYESYEGNNGSDNNVVRLLSHKEEDDEADEVQNEDEGRGVLRSSEILKEEEVIHHPIAQPRDIGNNTVDQRGVNGVAVQMTSQYPIPPPPPPRRKLNQRVPVDTNNGVIPKEQQHFHLPPPPPPPPRRNEVKRPIIKSSVIENKSLPPKPIIDDSKTASISQTHIDVTNEASQEADTEIDNDKQEEFLDTLSELASQINNTLQGIAPTEEDSPQSNNSNKQEEFDIDSLIPKNPSHNRSTEECMVKEQYKEYLYPDDESLNDSSYKLHMKRVVKDSSTDTNKSVRQRGRSRRSKKSSRKKKLEVLSSVSESTSALDTSSASSASDSDNSEGCESDDDKLTVQTSQLVANLQDYISNI